MATKPVAAALDVKAEPDIGGWSAMGSEWSGSGSGPYPWDGIGTSLAEVELAAWRETGAGAAFRCS